MKPTPTEKLILSMLCDLSRDRTTGKALTRTLSSTLLVVAIIGLLAGSTPDVFGGCPDSPELVREVVDILQMWTVLEHHYDHLEETDKARVASEAAPCGTDVKFMGFYANEESSHLSIAEFLIEHIGNYPRFKAGV